MADPIIGWDCKHTVKKSLGPRGVGSYMNIGNLEHGLMGSIIKINCTVVKICPLI